MVGLGLGVVFASLSPTGLKGGIRRFMEHTPSSTPANAWPLAADEQTLVFLKACGLALGPVIRK